MAESLKVDPDLEFIEDMAKLGGESFKQCFQCATCSGTCPISPDKDPFPRKEMVWAVWGLKDKLVKDPDIWLCHQCNDCSIMCPRGGNPGDVLAVARSYAYQHYALPSFLGKALATAKALPLLLAVPVVILLIALAAKTGFDLTMDNGQPFAFQTVATVDGKEVATDHKFAFAYFFPTTKLLDPIFVATAIVAVVLLVTGLLRFWRDISAETKPVRGIVSAVIMAITEILSHSRFNECDQAKGRYLAHMLTFYGFLALLATTTIVFLGYYTHLIHLPMPLYHPVKILGNVGAIAFFVGLCMLIKTRATDAAKAGKSNYQDWLFLGVMIGLAVTGILTQLIRLAGQASESTSVIGLACFVYFLHLVLVWFLIAYLPFSKFAHLAYRFVAIIHAKYIGRYEMVADQPAATVQPAATSGEAAA
ncbi:MAG: quinone-interacting membrane-bound oxidoreductase complex subunit QmoC [Phycisphaerae bacterium]|nr:quinone-interacting membrane-bound oxidoreductase complex subunit QmoC [Phycisphaerae bacterium]